GKSLSELSAMYNNKYDKRGVGQRKQHYIGARRSVTQSNVLWNPQEQGVSATISAGYFHSLGLLDNGQVVGWGNDDYGQASGGAAALAAAGEGRLYVAVSAGYFHSL